MLFLSTENYIILMYMAGGRPVIFSYDVHSASVIACDVRPIRTVYTHSLNRKLRQSPGKLIGPVRYCNCGFNLPWRETGLEKSSIFLCCIIGERLPFYSLSSNQGIVCVSNDESTCE